MGMHHLITCRACAQKSGYTSYNSVYSMYLLCVWTFITHPHPSGENRSKDCKWKRALEEAMDETRSFLVNILKFHFVMVYLITWIMLGTVNYIHVRLTSVSDVIKKWSQRWRILKPFLRVILSLLTCAAKHFYIFMAGSDGSATLGLCFSSF
jgi:hypothetical protein